MFFLNLTFGQFLALLGAGSALIVALYLLDRSRRRLVVATLRFWAAAQRAPEAQRRRRIQQWPSLLLQLLALALLLAALGDLQLGSPAPAFRDHVIVLDTSAWMAAHAGDRSLMEEAQQLARAYLRRLPAGDRVMLVRADALATPAVPFTLDRAALEHAIGQSRPSATALRLGRALAFAERARRTRAAPGEIVFIGAARVTAEQEGESVAPPSRFRLLEVRAPLENCGLRSIVLQRAADDPALWRVFVKVRNYGQRLQLRRLALAFGGAAAGQATLRLEPGAEQEASLSLRTRAAGWLEVRLSGRDALPDDDEAVLELPALRQIRVLAYSRRPDLLRPLLSAGAWLRAEFRSPDVYDPAAPADVVILDQFCPRVAPATHAVWLDPPLDGAPVAVRRTLAQVRLARWRTDHPVAAGLRTGDLLLPSARVLVAGAEDAPVAEIEAGPVILARSSRPKAVIFGFHPPSTTMRYEVALPLLFANLLRWMAPEAFAGGEVHAQSAGSLSLELSREEASGVRVLAEDGRALPFTLEQNRLQLFTARPQQVRVLTAGGERVFSLTLPEVAEARWNPPPGLLRGLPPAGAHQPARRDLWPWLALAAGACLWLEGLLYGRLHPGIAGRRRLPWRWSLRRLREWRGAGQ